MECNEEKEKRREKENRSFNRFRRAAELTRSGIRLANDVAWSISGTKLLAQNNVLRVLVVE